MRLFIILVAFLFLAPNIYAQGLSISRYIVSDKTGEKISIVPDDALKAGDTVHQWLVKNRKGYHANQWITRENVLINEDRWAIPVPVEQEDATKDIEKATVSDVVKDWPTKQTDEP